MNRSNFNLVTIESTEDQELEKLLIMEDRPRNAARGVRPMIVCNMVLSLLTLICLIGVVVYLVPKIENAESKVEQSAGLLEKANRIPQVDWDFVTNQTEQEKLISWLKYLINLGGHHWFLPNNGTLPTNSSSNSSEL